MGAICLEESTVRKKTKTRVVHAGDIPITIEQTVDVFTGKYVLDVHTPRASGDAAFEIGLRPIEAERLAKALLAMAKIARER